MKIIKFAAEESISPAAFCNDLIFCSYHIPIIRVNLQHIIDLAQQLHSVSILWNLRTNSMKVFPDTKLSAVI